MSKPTADSVIALLSLDLSSPLSRYWGKSRRLKQVLYNDKMQKSRQLGVVSNEGKKQKTKVSIRNKQTY